ncbi:MAG TPA: YdeI/OmpD-associated family protein [Pyrinomonadaceae bacterium]
MSHEPKSPDGKPIVEFPRKSAWMAWLKKNYNKSAGVWLRLVKKGSGVTSISRNDALDVALCFGWIDGMAKSEGDTTWLQKFTPRSKRSIWSKKNRENVQRLIESGEMQPSGLAEVERAKSDGRWDAAYDSPRTMTVPDDLQSELDKNRKAKSFFAKLDSRNRYAILFRIHNARKPETRARRIREFVEMLERGERVHS